MGASAALEADGCGCLAHLAPGWETSTRPGSGVPESRTVAPWVLEYLGAGHPANYCRTQLAQAQGSLMLLHPLRSLRLFPEAPKHWRRPGFCPFCLGDRQGARSGSRLTFRPAVWGTISSLRLLRYAMFVRESKSQELRLFIWKQ